jgi:hypothetical protein
MNFNKGDKIWLKPGYPGLRRYTTGRVIGTDPKLIGGRFYYKVLVNGSSGLRVNLLASEMKKRS